MYLKLTIFCLLVITLNTIQAEVCRSGYPQACQATLDFVRKGLSVDEIEVRLINLFVASDGCWPYNIVAADDEEDLIEHQKEAQLSSNPLRIDEIRNLEELKTVLAANKSKRTFDLVWKVWWYCIKYLKGLLSPCAVSKPKKISDTNSGQKPDDSDAPVDIFQTDDPIAILEECSKYESTSLIDLLDKIQLLIKAQPKTNSRGVCKVKVKKYLK